MRKTAPTALVLALAAAAPTAAPTAAAGDEAWAEGEKLTLVNCGRCHVIGQRNRMGGIGSTPSFMVIRARDDWEDRMKAFWTVNPHPAFTQIEGITPPFPQNRPSPIHPISLTRAELETIVAYARSLAPAELGAEMMSR